MKKIIIYCLLLLTLSCSINKVSKTHGFRHIENKYDKILLNTSNKNDVRRLIGPPSSISDFNNSWIYIERKKTNQDLFKLGKKKISKNNILILDFNDRGILTYKKLLDINDMKEIKFAQKNTSKKYEQDNLVYNLLSTLREKINAPTRNKK